MTSERKVILAAAIGLALFLVFTELAPTAGRSAPSNFAPGKKVPVRITLVSADAYDLACAGSEAVADARCAFEKDGSPSEAAKSGKGILAPYMTVDNVLVLIPDLWSEPALAARLERDQPQGKNRDELKRFNARCDLDVQRKVSGFFVRWLPTAAWSARDDAWAGTISGCSID
ncbi:hypothetical protein AKJ08_2108 [Vulgatibacter incomptus]|uniref:Uncharacterized protein n=1 Tax=Vulgatibacter incomptus TaxID=1391653 RepID=A0A0K1PE92_9BACT|nr:hypothetical protein AKJ08_2108 [Vulgatibacter incomptus]